MGMFGLLHFYYGVPEHGLKKVAVGAAAIFMAGFMLSLLAFKLGNAFRSVLVFTSGALALDFFYRSQAGQPATSLVFNYLANGPAAVNFASFGFLAVWFASQLERTRVVKGVRGSEDAYPVAGSDGAAKARLRGSTLR